MKIEFVILSIVFFWLVIILPAVYDETQDQTDLYCEMVEIHKETNKEYGWAPYKGTEICKNQD